MPLMYRNHCCSSDSLVLSSLTLKHETNVAIQHVPTHLVTLLHRHKILLLPCRAAAVFNRLADFWKTLVNKLLCSKRIICIFSLYRYSGMEDMQRISIGLMSLYITLNQRKQFLIWVENAG